MKDVAQSVGVSVTTVSHALNGTRFVDQATKNRVLKCVQELGYVPNILAQSLKGKGTKTIGIIVSDISETFFSEIVKSIEKTAGEEGYNIMLCDSEGSSEKEDLYIHLLLQKGADGLIIAPVDQYKEFQWENQTSKPYVQIDRKIQKAKGSFIGIDNAGSAQRAVEILIENGCQKIGFIGYKDLFYTMGERRRGYLNALESAGLPPYQFISEHRGESLDSLAVWMRQVCPDGLLCTNEVLSYYALLAAEENKVDVPQDLKIIGYDDARWLSLLKTPLTVLRQPTEEIGRSAIQKIIELIGGTCPEGRKDIIHNWEMVVRESCGSQNKK
ncbi:LacI family transcriptional regulator [Oceanispirochaeta crateris]|uniref:LacI family transcriptional regulator n=1 Tax=Oceanispirochaeta crateris TaxID=2518645 RepID=A0A5C1QRK4_9SPIO|nr:LacI family DNA-binding transcriptional regulator [Oceanispirochaeta crateris]QEN08712.1 LacI family transcriptional regulator [Oceanispirochaeta crateris]